MGLCHTLSLEGIRYTRLEGGMLHSFESWIQQVGLLFVCVLYFRSVFLNGFVMFCENLRLTPSVSMTFRRFRWFSMGFLQPYGVPSVFYDTIFFYGVDSCNILEPIRELSCFHPISSGQQSAVHQTPLLSSATVLPSRAALNKTIRCGGGSGVEPGVSSGVVVYSHYNSIRKTIGKP